MAKCVRFRVIDGVAVVSLDSPPVNALSAELRAGLWQVFERVRTQNDISGAVLRAEGGLFSAGADIRELAGNTHAQPSIGQLCTQIESCPKPIVAALNGKVLGGGAELAMAAHYRIAETAAKIGFPEVSLGLLPGAGGTQRLPRLVGPEAALALMITGQSMDAPTALRSGFLDGLAQGELASGAVQFMQALIAKGQGARPTQARREKLQNGRSYQQAIAKARADLKNNPLFAPHLIVDCVEAAALLPFDAGEAMEADAFERCLRHPQSMAMRHVFVAERRIDPALLVRSETGFKPTPDGKQRVRRLRTTMRDRMADLVKAGRLTENQVDAAMVAYGFRKGVFGTRPAPVPDQAVMRRVVVALLIEGAAMLEDGSVARPSDVDALAVHGLGFPRREGGPMRAAQTLGLLALQKDMRAWGAEDAWWSPPSVMTEALKNAAGFDALA